MENGSAAALTAANTISDKEIIQKFIKYKKEKRLIWNGYKPDGRKNQSWESGEINLDEHLDPNSAKKYGVNTAFLEDGKLVAQNSVVDIDDFKKTGKNRAQFCSDVFKTDASFIPFLSPSGENFHLWKFHNKPIPVTEAAYEARTLGFKLKDLGYKVDFGKCNPSKSGGDVGINLPFAYDYQRPLDPRGNFYNNFQLVQRIRFQKFPYIAAIINLPHGTNRHDALLYAAGQLAHAGHDNLKYYIDIKNAFDHSANQAGQSFDEDWFKRVIQEERLYLKYQLSTQTINEKIGEYIGVKNFRFDGEWKKPEPKIEKPTAQGMEEPPAYLMEEFPPEEPEEISELEVKTYSAKTPINPRDWVVKGICLKGAATAISAAPGSGKTTSGSMLCYSIVTGKQFFGHDVYETGNVLMIVNEETENEINIKIKALEKEYGTIDTENRIDCRTVEDVTKFAEFKKGKATPTIQFKQLEKAIEKNNYKLIYIDPLISIKSGEFDENSNDNMETLIKDFVIKLSVKYNIPVVVAHHTNKIHANAFDDIGDQVTIDNLSMQNAARGASSLMGAVRAGFVMMNMPKKLWEEHYEEIAGDKYKRNSLVGFFDAKSNYSAVGDKPLWLDKKLIQIPTVNGMEVETIILKVSDLNDMVDASFRTYQQKNEEKIIALMPEIKKFFELDQSKMEQIANFTMQPLEAPLNELSTFLYKKDPQFQNKQVKASTLNSRYKRLLEQVQKPIEIPNSKLKFSYFYDRYESKTKHKVKIEPIKSRVDVFL